MDDICYRSPDAEYILQGIEFDLPWRETQISPKTAIKKGLTYRGIDEPVEDFIKSFLRVDSKRFQAIRNWAQDELREAIHESPILIVETDAGWNFVDGWHRAALAWEEGLKRITALILDGTGIDLDAFDI